MLQIKNSTPFIVELNVFPNERGIETLYIVVKATFSFEDKLKVADIQQPVFMADEYWGEPGHSSIKYAAEMHLMKPSTDIILIGEACAPDKKMVQELDVTLSVGTKSKTIKVFGDRKWVSGLVGLRKSQPIPFESMPMVYERAYGGIHEVNPEKGIVLYEPLNPVGKGFKGKRRKKDMKGTSLPNLEDPKKLIKKPKDKPTPACFGHISPNWKPRQEFAGTYDELWQKKKAPYLPDDFKPAFFNSGHPDLVCDTYLKGGEPVRIENVSPKGPIKFNLPVCDLDTAVIIDGQKQNTDLNLETILLEPNENRLSMLYRAEVECDKKALKVELVEIQPKRETHDRE